MREIIGLDNIAAEIKNNLDSDKDVLLYAFNATGKTRLSRTFDSGINASALCYNAYIEDSFVWDNDEKILKFVKNDIFSLVEDNGLDQRVVDVFKMCVGTKIEPFIDFNTCNIEFKLATGDNQSARNIKVSKGEESVFKWALFFVLVDYALQECNENSEEFTNLRYIIIDDPITSLDDYKVCSIASQIIELIKVSRKKKLNIRFLITTHHLMFFNIIKNSYKNNVELKKTKKVFYEMKKEGHEIKCEDVKGNNSLVYHIQQLKLIKKSIHEDNITKNLFNVLRSVLEKMSVILGYDHWNAMFFEFNDANSVEYEMFVNSLNMNSHNQYSDIDSSMIAEDQKGVFVKGFNFFLDKFKIKV